MDAVTATSDTRPVELVTGPTMTLYRRDVTTSTEKDDKDVDRTVYTYRELRFPTGEYELVRAGMLPPGVTEWTEDLRRIQRSAILDEADKLTEPVFHYFISLYNKLEDKSGVIFMSTDYIKKRIERGLRYQKPGYKEFFSRMGRKYFELEETSATDVYSICMANGLQDKKKIDEVIRDAETCDFDLRRVKKAIHRAKRMSE